MRCYKFTDTQSEAREDFFTNDWMRKQFEIKNILWHNDLMRHGYEKSGGWLYDFKDVLKKYLVKQYEMWSECYAPNKTLLRKNTCGRIQQIVEI